MPRTPCRVAAVETWQANGQGFYESQFPDLQPDCNLRGIFTTDRLGFKCST
jgi:hydroxyquinol 1,2-dioxygenase